MSDDYSGWLERAATFLSSLEAARSHFLHVEIEFQAGPLLRLEDLESLEARNDYRFPDPLRDFYCTAARTCVMSYRFWDPATEGGDALARIQDSDVAGGIKFVPASRVFDEVLECRAWDFTAKEQCDVWHNSVPFATMENGDYLGLDTRSPGQEFPVVYLCHDSDSFQLAGSFCEFLESWEQLSYIGPEYYELEIFRGPDKRLDPELPQARAFRTAFARVLGR